MDNTWPTSPDKKLLKIKREDRVDTTVPSPCIDVCMYSSELSEEEDLCIGCLRNKTEIIYWWGWHALRKLQALEDIKKRHEDLF
jgi:predicted Fe-S protein YdhL (DUF1289 family)